LTKHDYNAALTISSRVTKEMLESLAPGDGSTKAFGLAIAYKALALAGLDRREEALWYWYTVVAVYPPWRE
jgi:hypothetical protein